MTVTKKILLGTLAFMAFAWISNASYEDEIIAENHYCSMVSIYESSGGQHGWPPYRSEINCKNSEEN